MKLYELRKKAGLTQKDLAEMLGVSQPTVCAWEAGVTAIPSTYLPILADLLHCTIDALFGRDTA